MRTSDGAPGQEGETGAGRTFEAAATSFSSSAWTGKECGIDWVCALVLGEAINARVR